MDVTTKTTKGVTTTTLPAQLATILDAMCATYQLPTENLSIVLDYTTTPRNATIHLSGEWRTEASALMGLCSPVRYRVNPDTRRLVKTDHTTVTLYLKGVKDANQTAFVFAHELGHAVDFARGEGQSKSEYDREVTADRYAMGVADACGFTHPTTLPSYF